MNLLDANDQPGQYPPSWYAATTQFLPPFPSFDGTDNTDICIIGAGYTGLSAALHLANQGCAVTLLEAQRVGFGASGRNGGQLGSGQRLDQETLLRWLGPQSADALWDLAEEAIDCSKSLIKQHKIDCFLKPGIAELGFSNADRQNLHRSAAFLQKRYGYDKITLLDEAASQALCPSALYKGGVLDHGSAHLHPLRYVLGLAKAAAAAGVRIYEKTRVIDLKDGVKPTITTANGQITCAQVILACNGYLGKLHPKIARHVMPINNFIAATEPLGPATTRVLTQDVAVADTKFVVNYFRLSHDGRLLFGGGESYGYRFPTDIAAKVRTPMLKIFPHLKDVKLEYAWGGTLGITMRRTPYFARMSKNIITASGYSGHGVGTATHAGKLIGQAIMGQANGFDTMSQIPQLPFPGGRYARLPLLVLAMTWYSLRDRLGL